MFLKRTFLLTSILILPLIQGCDESESPREPNPKIRYGTISYTTDGGGTWQTDRFDEYNEIDDFIIIRPGTFHIVDELGEIMASTDDGTTWTNQTVTGLKFNNIANTVFSDVGLATGRDASRNGIIYKTTNAGDIWFPVYSIVNGEGISIMTDLNYGIVLKADGKMVYTSNSGSSWNTSTITPLVSAVYYTKLFNACAITRDGHVYRSTNAGNSFSYWSTMDTTGITDASGIFGTDVGIAIDSKKIYRTTDEGFSWSIVDEHYGDLNDVFCNNIVCVVTGKSSMCLISRDNGLTWQYSSINAASNPDFIRAYFQEDGQFGYVVGTVSE